MGQSISKATPQTHPQPTKRVCYKALTHQRLRKMLVPLQTNRKKLHSPDIAFYWGTAYYDYLAESGTRSPTCVFRVKDTTYAQFDKNIAKTPRGQVCGELSTDGGNTFEDWTVVVCADGKLSNNCISGVDGQMFVAIPRATRKKKKSTKKRSRKRGQK